LDLAVITNGRDALVNGDLGGTWNCRMPERVTLEMELEDRKVSHILRILQSCILLGGLAVGTGTAGAMQLQLNQSAPFLCAAVQGGNTANGTPVIAYSCSGGPNDQWQYVNAQFEGLGTANGQSMCLDIKGQGTAPGTLVDLWDCNGQPNQQWEVINGASVIGAHASTLIYNFQSNLCLDSSGGPSVGGGTQLVVNDCGGTTSQNWTLRAMQFQINANAPYICIAVSGSDTAAGTPVITSSCDGDPSQLWSYAEGQIVGLGSANGANLCMTALSSGRGALVGLDKCTVKESQQWFFRSAGLGSGNAILKPVGTGGVDRCLDSEGGPPVGGGTQLTINPCSGEQHQNWNIR
jgi:hypothetical protein